jgi:uncharacterized integral membrane protein
MGVVVFVLGALVGMAVLIFAYENQEPVTLRYLFTWQLQPIPLFVVLMAAVAVGFVIASLFGLAAYLHARKLIRQQRRTIAELGAELHALRTLPLEAPSEPEVGRQQSDSSPPAASTLSPR